MRTRPELAEAKRHLERVLVTCSTSKHRTFTFVSSELVIDKQNVVFADSTAQFFSVMSSRLHEVWSTFFSSTLEDRLVYTPSDCYDSFAFPVAFETSGKLEEVGKAYYEFRADLMVRNKEGLTKTYNRFHDPNEDSPDIVRLRELHAAMDRADRHHHDLYLRAGRKVAHLAQLTGVVEKIFERCVGVQRTEVLFGDLECLIDALFNGNGRNDNDKFCEAVTAIQLKDGAQVDIGLACAGLHLHGEMWT